MTDFRRIAAMLVLIGLLGCTETPPQQQSPRGPETTGKARGPIRITDEELHRHGGTPPGWKFTVPDGDPEAGRAVFVELECYSCHHVAGEKFLGSGAERQTGPDLTGMGPEHPAEYLAEAILNPNAVIIAEPGYTGQDGLSTMPSYADLLTLKEWVDLVAYLKSLNGGSPHMEKGRH